MMDHKRAGLTDDQARQIYRWMLLTRRLDERLSLMQRMGTIPIALSPKGHEAAQVGVACAFRRGIDWWFPYYRDLAVALIAGSTPLDLIRASLGRTTDPASGGRQMPYNWGDRRHHIVARSAPVGVQIPQAAGVALAAVRRGDPIVVYCGFGEGAASAGDFHEGINFAALHHLPVLYVCQNNGWAISTPANRQSAGGTIAGRAAGYGIPGIRLDGTDPFAVYKTATEAVDEARAGGGPTLLELQVPRLESHTSDDHHARYRTAAELADLAAADPLPQVRQYLHQAGLLSDTEEAAMEAAIQVEVDTAEQTARAEPLSEPEM